jgi:hypothetical protein
MFRCKTTQHVDRMFTGSLTEEVKTLQEDIAAVEDKIDDQIMCEKLKLFINASPEIQSIYHMDAGNGAVFINNCMLKWVSRDRKNEHLDLHLEIW